MEKPNSEKDGDAVLGQEAQSASNAKKSAGPLNDQEWLELKQLRETEKQNAKDRHFDDICSRVEELTDDELTRLNELNQRLYATTPHCSSAHAAQYALLQHEIPDLKRRLDSLGSEIWEAKMTLSNLQWDYDKLQRELAVCEVVRDRMVSPRSPEEHQAYGEAVRRLGRLIKSAGQRQPTEGYQITDEGVERRIPAKGSNAND